VLQECVVLVHLDLYYNCIGDDVAQSLTESWSGLEGGLFLDYKEEELKDADIFFLRVPHHHPSSSQSLSHLRNSRPKTTDRFPAFRSCGGDHTRCFFQGPVPGARHPLYFDTQLIVVIHRFFQYPIQGPGYFLSHFQRRTIGFL
jgi:hypothetical protein